MKVAYLFPEELPMRAARGIQAVNTAWALARREDVLFIPASFGREAVSFYGLTGPGPEIKPLSRRLGPLKSQFFFVQRALPLIRASDVVFTRHLKTAWWLGKLRPLHRRPVIYEAHEIFAEKHLKMERLEEEVFRRADLVCCVSRGLRAAIKARYLREAVVVPNGAWWRVREVRQKFSAEDVGEAYYAGSFRYAWKGQNILLRVADMLPEGLKIAVIGEARFSHPRVKVLGFHPPAEVQRLLDEAQVAILPNLGDVTQSRFYTCPLKLLDYMAAGCAIVASDLPSVREIVSPKEALLVPPDDPRALAEGIKQLASDRELRLSLAQAAHERAKEFTWERRAERISKLLREVPS